MKKPSAALSSLLLCLAVWSVFSWPLPKMAGDGIPASARNTEEAPARYMFPGDHLQFFYHFTLVSHFAAGEAPLFANIYEFNRGSDEERYSPGPYYAPFSLVFAALAPLTGPAAAWNLVGLLSLWITLWATWALLRRYVDDPWIIGAAALISIALPFRWTALAGGSPTGLGMMWVPLAFLGFERFIVEGRAGGAFLAGLAVFLSSWVDDHVFFFVALAAVPWMAFAWCMQKESLVPDRSDLRARLRSAWPLLLFAIPSLWQVLGTSRRLAGTDIGGGGRPLHEVAIFSPRMVDSLVFWKGTATSETYLGIVALVLILAGLASALGSRRRRRLSAGLGALAVAVFITVALAAGTHNPFGPAGWKALTTLIPPYGMIRSPMKVFLLMPTLLAVAAALSAKAIFSGPLSKRHRMVVVLAALALLADYGLRTRLHICLLDEGQGAYEAVVADAAAAGKDPRILALPLWPGNSHWTSINQYYASLYGIRMINGYKPTVPTDYRREVFEPYEQFNKGSFPDELLDRLLAAGIAHIVLHEDAFPEKVSPFGVSHTIAALLNHPRISFLDKERNVWAFRIEKEPGRSLFPLLPWRLRSAARIWELERYGGGSHAVTREDSAGGGSYITLAGGDLSIATPVTPVPSLAGISWMLRLRGYGTLEITVRQRDGDDRVHGLSVAGADWDWVSLPLSTDGYGPVSLLIKPLAGSVDADTAGIFMPEDLLPLDGPVITFPPAIFFHAGYTDLEKRTVVFSPERVPARKVLYGPRLPLQAGRYTMTVDYESPAAEGTLLGSFSAGDGDDEATGSLVAGLPFELDYAHRYNRLFSLGFEFSRNAPVGIGTITLRRTE